MKVYWLLGVLLAGCTKPNPAVCCLDAADCSEVGLDEVRSCSPGLACVDHQCEIPSCSMTGCMAAMPVCNITTDVCEGCTDSSNCSRFADTDVCDPSTGACVECVGANDCGVDKPICDANTCRGCELDSECASGACGDDGACVAESAIVYLDAAGTDAGECPRSAPCRTLTFGVSKTTATRSHLVLAPGGYVETVRINAQDTAATRLYIHGGGAGLSSASDENSALYASVPSTIRDLKMNGPLSNAAITLYAGSHVLENLQIVASSSGIAVGGGAAEVRNVTVTSTGPATGFLLGTGAQLTIDGAVLHGGANGIKTPTSEFGVSVNLTNVLIWGTTGLALDLPNTGGTVSFATIADGGSDSGTGPRAVNCAVGLTVRSSIIWTPGTTSRIPIQGCNLVSTIAGPTFTPGAINSDPLFVNNVAHDYHLGPSSPARDAVDTGPATDFEGDARPQGARFDIGADEAK
jgi:hypothetical protein